jgi:hypothetical protein
MCRRLTNQRGNFPFSAAYVDIKYSYKNVDSKETTFNVFPFQTEDDKSLPYCMRSQSCVHPFVAIPMLLSVSDPWTSVSSAGAVLGRQNRWRGNSGLKNSGDLRRGHRATLSTVWKVSSRGMYRKAVYESYMKYYSKTQSIKDCSARQYISSSF